MYHYSSIEQARNDLLAEKLLQCRTLLSGCAGSGDIKEHQCKIMLDLDPRYCAEYNAELTLAQNGMFNS